MDSYCTLAPQQVEIDTASLSLSEFRTLVATFIKDSRAVVLKKEGSSGNSLITLSTLAPMPSREELTPEQGAFLEVVESSFKRTAFPWLETSNIKKVDTLMKKLSTLYQSDRAREELLGTQSAWDVRTFLQSQLDEWMQEKKLGAWSWADGIDKQPRRDPRTNPALDMLEGPLMIDDKESIGNSNARLHSYTELRIQNHNKMQRIARLALSEGLGLGSSKQAIPEVRKSLEALLTVDVMALSEHTHTRANDRNPADPQEILRAGHPSKAKSNRGIR